MAIMTVVFVLQLSIGRLYHATAARIQSLVGLEDEVLMFSTFAEANGKKIKGPDNPTCETMFVRNAGL